MRISILTSSRADYGIYLPLLQKMKEDNYFQLNIIAFGSHFGEFGTVDSIVKDGFEVGCLIETFVDDSPQGVAKSMGGTIQKFSKIWEYEKGKTDLIICLGDRYEMFAAVSASLPFNMPIAHIHGGETTLGAIDNVFRHSLTMMSSIHFASSENHVKKIKSILDISKNVFDVGSLSLDNLDEMNLLTKEEFAAKFDIEFNMPTILVTFHPETVSYDRNALYATDISSALGKLTNFQVIITMPNQDTMGSVIRESFEKLSYGNKNIVCVENFGKLGYFSCMKHCQMLLGNTSSGIIEAASFNKYVINLGDRQLGRDAGENVFHVSINQANILKSVKEVYGMEEYMGVNLYKKSTNTSSIIIQKIKEING